MENYKILVNRPELTTEQMVQSLEFNEVKNHYTAYKKALIKSAYIKSVFIKVAIGTTILTSSIIIYKYNSGSTPKKQQPIIPDTVQTNAVKKEEIRISNDTNTLSPLMSLPKSRSKKQFVAVQINSVNATNTIYDSITEINIPLKEAEKKNASINKENSNPAITKYKEPFRSNKQRFAQQNAKIYFIRTTGFNGSAIAFRAFVDDTLKCKLNNKSYSIHEISPGKHIISAQISGKKSKAKTERITIETEAGKTYYVQMIYKVGLLVNNLHCQEVPEKSVLSILVNLKEDQNCN
jgi:hypothetical protein